MKLKETRLNLKRRKETGRNKRNKIKKDFLRNKKKQTEKKTERG